MLKLLVSISCLLLLSAPSKPTADECEIEAFYKGTTPTSGSKALTSSDELEDIELILTPIEIDAGKYVVNITRKGSNLYKIDGKNIYLETRYSYEYSYGDEVVLKIESNYGYTKGKIIF